MWGPANEKENMRERGWRAQVEREAFATEVSSVKQKGVSRSCVCLQGSRQYLLYDKACPSGFHLLVVSVFSVKFDIGVGKGLGSMGSLKQFVKNY